MTSLEAPVGGSVSWLRAYATPTCVNALELATREGSANGSDAQSLLLDSEVLTGDDQFWDLQALRRCHVLRVVSRGSVAYQPSGSSEWVPVTTHLLLHRAGLTLIRLTLDPNEASSLGAIHDLAAYSDAVWQGDHMNWRVTLAGQSFVIDTDVRHTMDTIMFPLYERFCGRTPDLAALQQLRHHEDRYNWLDGLVTAGESYSAYPVTFGTSYELVWREPSTAHDSRRQIAELAYGIEQPGSDDLFLKPAESGSDHDWFLGENRAVLSITKERSRTSMDTYDAMRVQILEYLTLQRAALRSVQRSTQLVITEQDSISRAQLQAWQRLVAALTDEYVLHDQVALILGPVRAHMKSNPRLRDPASLEAQVRENLATFQALIDAASSRVAIVLSGLFGVVAALTLAPLAREIELAVFRTGGAAGNFETAHPILSITIDVILLVAVAATCVLLIGNANRLRRVKE